MTYSKKTEPVLSSPYTNVIDNEIEIQQILNDPGAIENVIWPLEGTMQDHYVQHDPMALFPEPSSTVPNATYTQQRVLETITAPALLGLESEADTPHYIPKASVPWSDMMNFSPAATAEQSDPPNQPGIPEATENAQDLSQQGSILSQRSRLGSTVHVSGSQLKNKLFDGGVNPENVMPPPWGLSSQDLGLSPEKLQESQKAKNGSSQGSKSETNLVPHSEDDLADIGLPKEQYVPRPSRSRSLKVDTQELVDYSVRPEKATKESKRRKTTPAAPTRASKAPEMLTTPDKIRQICDMGFTPTSTGRALEQNSGDVMSSVDWLISNGMGEDELAHNTPKEKSGSKSGVTDRSISHNHESTKPQAGTVKAPPAIGTAKTHEVDVANDFSTKSKINMEEADCHLDTVILPDGVQLKSPKVQVVINSKSPDSKSPPKFEPQSVSTKKAKRRKTTLDVPEQDTLLETPAVPAKVVEKKKGRGRPKKTANDVPSAETAQDVISQTLEKPRQDSREVLQAVEPNAGIVSGNEDVHVEPTTTNYHEPLVPAATKKSLPSSVPRTPDPTTEIASNSPATTKGKASYRVGLSKRARIAPLLRTLKK